MYTHAPQDYQCPFCKIVQGIEDETTFTNKHDVFFRNEALTAFVASHWWPNNPGHVIIIPNRHFENIYTLPGAVSHTLHAFEKKVAIALKEVYGCDGVSSRQHNEPAGDQDIWHVHIHVFPRYADDNLYLLHHEKKLSKVTDRLGYANRLKDFFEKTMVR